MDKGEFLESMEEGLKEVMDTVNSVEGQWYVLSSVMCAAEKECLGYEDRRQLDWFHEREVDIVMEENQGLHLITHMVATFLYNINNVTDHN